MSEKLDAKVVRELVKQLTSSDITPSPSGNYSGFAAPKLTVDGVVLIGCITMHPNTFKDIFGEEAYQELLKQPKVPNPYGDDIDS